MDERKTQALKAIILENLNDLRRFAYSLTNDKHDADDLTQIVVEKLLKHSIPEGANALSWMFRVCKNAWIDEIRSRKLRSSEDTVDVSNIGFLHDEDKKRDDDARWQELRNAINELPDAYRIVISLIVISGLSYADTAHILNVPIGTVMSRIGRAIEKLAAYIHKID